MGRTGATRGGLHLRAGTEGGAAGGASGIRQGSVARPWLCRLRAADDTRRRRARRLLGPYKTQVHEVVHTADTPLAHEALRRIAGLYAVEAQVRGQSSAHRLAARRTLAKPIVDALQIWLETHLPHLRGRGKLAKAMRIWHVGFPTLPRQHSLACHSPLRRRCRPIDVMVARSNRRSW
jgi:hypothetical protein